jgi:sugar lactone lactonase YvrE
MDDQRFLYVSDSEKDEVRRYRLGETNGIVVAGGNGGGAQLSQLNNPEGLTFDRHGNLYVADRINNRVQRFNIETS